MLAQQFVNGVLLGATYALFALGFTLMFGVLRVINLTYGFYFSAGALIALWLTRSLGASIWTALPAAALAAGLIAVVLDWLLLSRLRRIGAPELSSLMVTLGGVLALYAALTAWLGPDIRRLPPGIIPDQAFQLGDIRITAAQLLILGATAVLVTGLIVLLRGTRLGLAIRAMAEKPDAAQLMGINTGRAAAIVSFLSGALAGAGGVLIGLNFNAIQPYMGETMMLRGFVVIIVGGLGDIRGALLAGLLLGIIEVMTAAYVDSSLKEAVAFLILVAVLWTRPSGLFGRAVVRRA
ncbi:MAG: branched-chain amino acid ABC transporter permease [Oxalobacteraceae bacterium]|nr:MAG: branched-chain amino acid ABC transporter permease [Oxalobacteraceae bacterium]